MAPKKPIKKSKPEPKKTYQERTAAPKDKTSGSVSDIVPRVKGFFTDERTMFILGLFLFLIVLYVSLSFLSYFFTGAADQSKLDVPWSELKGMRTQIHNWASVAGAYISEMFINRWFGLPSFAMLWFFVVLAFRLMNVRISPVLKTFFHCFFWLIWGSVFLGFAVSPLVKNVLFFAPGGQHGDVISQWLISYIGKPGTLMLLIGLLVLYLVIGFKSALPFIKSLFKRKPKQTDDTERDDLPGGEEPSVAVGTEIVPEEWVVNSSVEDDFEVNKGNENDDIELEIEDDSDEDEDEDENDEDMELTIVDNPSEELSEDEKHFERYDPKLELSKYAYPTLDLLKVYDNENNTQIDMVEQNANKNRIITTLQNYGIEIESIKATVGPTITLYEIVPKAGIRISKIRNLEYDIMLSLAATGIRIIAPIPGKGTIGIEVPNSDPQVVSMHSVIASKKFQESKFELPIVFGRTITNENFMVDLTKMPHLLVAGATGQGKSVGLNAIITSLLYKKHPSELKLVLVDPKKVEFNIYGDIEKYFLAKLPDEDEAIITDTSKVVQTLNSLCKEMDDRYDLLKKAHVRNIKEYNEKFSIRQLNPENGHKYLPYIVVIVDEFGDLIMTAGKEVEMPIARIAQLARAVGIHMIIATQRPSVNIITGVIKANFPARVAFRVSSMIDSRTILDAPGANQLVGRGDMLFSQGSDLTRVQCAFVDTPEVEEIVHFIKGQQLYPDGFYLPEVAIENDFDSGSVDMSKRDPLFEEAARLIVSSQQGSTSSIQRKFSIGYNRAGRIVDQLEAAGIIGPNEGSKARQVLIMDEYSLEKILSSLQ
ncbi:DNA translocase FtsK [Paludibacter sp. 221]|uniref:FtsK/SpoIIIE family DNA translocase n=1 Tax=Paludibacter sp. 221 TaxID=2302939 RepID=UPI0013D82FCE|nr:DNA translocase FtsK [Paludibacter sp. 221]NDV47877.1 DNA translocase FtsK [Paludibacter sp. 221]